MIYLCFVYKPKTVFFVFINALANISRSSWDALGNIFASGAEFMKQSRKKSTNCTLRGPSCLNISFQSILEKL